MSAPRISARSFTDWALDQYHDDDERDPATTASAYVADLWQEVFNLLTDDARLELDEAMMATYDPDGVMGGEGP